MERYKQLIEIATDLFGGRMEETKELITTDDIRSKVYIIRGQQVMLDRKADVDIYHTHLQSKEFICLQQFFVEN